MGEERSTKNPQAAFIPKNTVESYDFQIRKIIAGLNRYDDSQKARDVAVVLNTALVLLNEGETEAAPVASDSPGVDDEGNALPPFTPMALPSGDGTPAPVV